MESPDIRPSNYTSLLCFSPVLGRVHSTVCVCRHPSIYLRMYEHLVHSYVAGIIKLKCMSLLN